MKKMQTLFGGGGFQSNRGLLEGQPFPALPYGVRGEIILSTELTEDEAKAALIDYMKVGFYCTKDKIEYLQNPEKIKTFVNKQFKDLQIIDFLEYHLSIIDPDLKKVYPIKDLYFKKEDDQILL